MSSCRHLVVTAARRSAVRGLRTSSVARDVFKDKEHAEENMYFAKEDRALLEKLLKKMKSSEESKLGELKALIAPHELPDEVLAKIVDWKMHH